MIVFPPRQPLPGTVVRLDPSTVDDAADLFAALDDQRVWESGFGGGPAGRWTSPEATARVLSSREAERTAGRHAMYTVRLRADSDLGAAGTVVGTTSLADWDAVNASVQLGYTGYGPRWWGTTVNPDCKLTLLTCAFEQCGRGRVFFQVDDRNPRSQQAVERLGAVREGTLRRHKRRADGSFRDTVVFSVLADEWPDVRAGLTARLAVR